MKLELKDVTLERLFEYVSYIKDRGDLVFIKYDGERNANTITVIISYPPPLNSIDNQIRFEGDNLKDLLIKLIYTYYEENKL